MFLVAEGANSDCKLTCIHCCHCHHCSGVVLRVLFHPKQLQLFSGGDDAEVRVWDLVTKACVGNLKVGAGVCVCVYACMYACMGGG